MPSDHRIHRRGSARTRRHRCHGVDRLRLTRHPRPTVGGGRRGVEDARSFSECFYGFKKTSYVSLPRHAHLPHVPIRNTVKTE